MKKIVLFVILASVVSFSAMAQKTEVLHFIVESGAFQRINTPVSVDIEGISKSDTLSFQLFEKTKGQLVEKSCQVEPLTGLKAYLVDLTTFLSVAGTSPITFEAYRYGGGIGIRANEEWTRDNSTVLTSEGKTRIDADGTRARWTDLNGAFSILRKLLQIGFGTILLFPRW